MCRELHEQQDRLGQLTSFRPVRLVVNPGHGWPQGQVETVPPTCEFGRTLCVVCDVLVEGEKASRTEG